jgi:hypothetical protein
LIGTLEERYSQAQKFGSDAHAIFFNTALFNALAEQDISGYNRALYLAGTESERHFHSRHLAVLLYEIAEDYTELLGRKYENSLAKLGVVDDNFAHVVKIRQQVREFRKKHEKSLGEIRKYIGAHRDHIGIEQLRVGKSFDSMAIYRLAAEFSVVIRALSEFCLLVLPIVDSPRSIVRNIKPV